MKDINNTEIKAGDIVVYATARSTAVLCAGIVTNYCKNGCGAIRVKVFQSGTYWFAHDRKNYRTGEITRKAFEPYMTTLGCSNRVMVIPGGLVNWPLHVFGTIKEVSGYPHES